MIQLTRHPKRDDLLSRVSTLDPEVDYEAIYQILALHEFPWDMVTALNLAFYRTFAAPRMAALLVQTGEVQKEPTKRAADTGLFMYDLIASGLHSQRGLDIVRQLNGMHRRWEIEAEDYLYVLAAFVVVPARWIDSVGWRPLSDNEKSASVRFYGELGRLMGISDLPNTYEAVANVFDAYETRHLRYSSNAATLLEATRSVLESRLPSRLQFLAGPLLRAMLDEPLSRCFGVRPAGPLLRTSFAGALSVRRAVLRRRGPRADPWFTPGRAMSLYPTGYDLADLGPAAHRAGGTADAALPAGSGRGPQHD